jgi:IclR family acetate operon transcriptional repressor
MPGELEAVAPTRQRVQSVSRALAILREVAAADGLTVQEISRRVGLRSPTTYHLVHTLADEGFLGRGERGRYRLGSSVGSLAQAFRRQIAPPAHLLPHLRSVGLRTGEASHIVGWSNGEIMVLGQVPGRHPVSVTEFAVGTVGDAHARSSGKLLLAFADAETRAEYLRLHPPRGRTPATIVEPAVLEREFLAIRERGYSVDLEEYAPGVCCLAAPVDLGDALYSFSLLAPSERFKRNVDDYLAVLLAAAVDASVRTLTPSAEARTASTSSRRPRRKRLAGAEIE